MITLYTARGCAMCDQLKSQLRQHDVEFLTSIVSERDVDRLLALFPQVRSETGLFGLMLPFGADGDRLIGGYEDILREQLA